MERTISAEKATAEAVLAGSGGVVVEAEVDGVGAGSKVDQTAEATEPDNTTETEQAPEWVCDLEPDKPWADSIRGKTTHAAAAEARSAALDRGMSYTR